MNQTELEEMLIEVVCRLQELSGREKVSVTSDTKPVLDMPGFDSLNGVEATVEVLDCVFRSNPATIPGRFRPPIPV